MAIAQAFNLNQNNPTDFFPNTDINTHEYAIQGKMIVASCRISSSQTIGMTADVKDKIRTELIHQIADYVLQNNLVEFTQIKDPITLDLLVKARCFMAPNDNVQILRSLHKAE
jgi:hypothetical protein